MTRRPLRIALLADGGSDRALLPVIHWVIRQHDPDSETAQPGFRPRNPGNTIAVEMQATVELFDPDILFVHRDAEGQDPGLRRQEIPDLAHGLVRVVPVRMTEAWLQFDEGAIRTAAGNPTGRVPLELPSLRRIEDMPDPKAHLRGLLLTAAEVTGRRRKRMHRDLPAIVHRVAELIGDFERLRAVPAFAQFESDCRVARENADRTRRYA